MNEWGGPYGRYVIDTDKCIMQVRMEPTLYASKEHNTC
jgi:hypothetical protein